MRTGTLSICIILFLCGYARGRSPEVVPQAPSNLEVLARDFDFIYIMWQDNSDNEDRFIIERHTEGEEFARYDTVDINKTTYLDSDVEPNTRYFYRVYAENSEGASIHSNEIDISTYDLPNRPPYAPGMLSGYFDGVNANLLSWQDNSENELSFKIYRSENGTSYSLHDSVLRDVTSYKDVMILSYQTYQYYIVAENHYGASTPSDTISVEVGEITGSGDVPVLSLISVSATSVTLRWTYVLGEEALYTLHRASGQDTSHITIADSLSYTDSGLLSNTDYSYQVEAEDQNGNSVYSQFMPVTTLPWFTQHRVRDSLILFFVFSRLRDNSVPDQSWYKAPSDLSVTDTSGLVFTDSSFLRLESFNTLVADSIPKIIEACKANREITIECWIKTSELPDQGPASILSVENGNAVAFSLSCIRDDDDPSKVRYFTNLTTNTTDNRGNPDFNCNVSVNTGVLHHIVYTHNQQGEEVFYINGKAVNTGFRPPKYDNWEDDYSLLLANNQSGDAPWLGNYYMCALYNRALGSDEISQNYYASPFSSIYHLNSAGYTLNVFPNPSRNEFWIDFLNDTVNLEVTEKYNLLLLNQQGLLVRSLDVSDIINIDRANLPVSGLAPGVYSLLLTNPYGLVDAKSIVILP